MTINELIKNLNALVAADEYRGDMQITFGQGMEPVEGGIIARDRATGLSMLNLAPIKMDKQGEF